MHLPLGFKMVKISCTGLLSSVWYRNIALPQCMLCINRLEPVAGLIVYSLCKNIVTECCKVHKGRYGMRHRMNEIKKKERKKKVHLL
jgi:hypothetical protein